MQLFLMISLAPLTVLAQSPPLWGFAASAIQIEGSWNVSRGPSVWDNFQAPSAYGSSSVAADHYRRYKDDIVLMGSFKATAYRFSFSWARIFPSCSGTPNEEGLKYYSDLIDALLRQGIEPIATMYHWDLPAKCQEEYGGWTDKRIVQDFTNYALLLADRFSDRIRYWLTVNEPSPICFFAYSNGAFAPVCLLSDIWRYHTHNGFDRA
jgi:beta-glucosidase/6-phospho-beta-glucosidase/beta-galactosidase